MELLEGMICNKCGQESAILDSGGRILSTCCKDKFVFGGEKVIESRVYVARKDHGDTVRKGERYRRIIIRHWRKGGPSWFTVERRVLS